MKGGNERGESEALLRKCNKEKRFIKEEGGRSWTAERLREGTERIGRRDEMKE